MRLIGGADGARHLAGVEIALDPGFKTCWRTPEIPGLPRFRLVGLENVAAADFRWPARPGQEDAGGTAYVYGGAVILLAGDAGEAP